MNRKIASSNKLDPRLVYYTLVGGRTLFFTLAFTVNMIYQVETVGLTPLQLVLVGTALEMSVFLFEVPTGVVADVYSRRLSIIIGVFLIGAGVALEGLIPAFAAILAGQALWGFGYTFTSGALQAWLVDEIGESNVGNVFLRGSQIGSVCGMVGLIVAVVIGSVQINLPIILGGVSFWALGVFLVLFMPETGFNPILREARSSWGSMVHTFRAGLKLVRGRTILVAIVGIGLFYGLFSEGYDRLSTAHFLDTIGFPVVGDLHIQPVVWFGIMSVLLTPISLVASEIVRRKVDAAQHAAAVKALFVISAGMVVGLAMFALAGSFAVALVAYWTFNALRGIVGPIFDTWSSQHIDSSVRATVMSMFGQVDAIGQIVGGPPVGLIGDRFGLRAALMTSALILSPVLLLFVRALRLNGMGAVASEAAVQEA